MCNSLSIKTKNEIHAEVIPASRLPNRAVTRKTPAPISQLVTLRANRKMAPRPEKCLKMFFVHVGFQRRLATPRVTQHLKNDKI